MAWDLIDEGSLLENSETKPGAFDSRSPVPDRLAAVVPLCPALPIYRKPIRCCQPACGANAASDPSALFASG